MTNLASTAEAALTAHMLLSESWRPGEVNFLSVSCCILFPTRPLQIDSTPLPPRPAAVPWRAVELMVVGFRKKSRNQAVVKSEAQPFREARNFLPSLEAATKWVDIEQSWGYARALASELSWRREIGATSSFSVGGEVSRDGRESEISGAPAAASATPTPRAAPAAEQPDISDAYCICRGEDYGSVMVECDACLEWYHPSW